jgi:YD repeat-containing protein
MKNGGVMSFGASSSLSGIANYFLTAINDRNGNALTITRDSGRNITEMSSASGKLSFSVDFNTGRIQKITDQGGRSVSYQYDPAGRLIKVVDPLGQEMGYSSMPTINYSRPAISGALSMPVGPMTLMAASPRSNMPMAV